MNGFLENQVPLWEKIGQESVYSNEFYSICENDFRHPFDGRRGKFLVIDINESVQIFAETTDGKVILVEQFRFGSGKLSIELPGGRLEKGEDIIAGAKRELFEETGYAGQNAKISAILYPNPAFQVNKMYAVHIANCSKVAPTHFDEMEELATITVAKSDLVQLVKSNKIKNSITLSAIISCIL
jgi:8-oxo-dGTP pyrophosphatase MutT (NUDIX family)